MDARSKPMHNPSGTEQRPPPPLIVLASLFAALLPLIAPEVLCLIEKFRLHLIRKQRKPTGRASPPRWAITYGVYFSFLRPWDDYRKSPRRAETTRHRCFSTPAHRQQPNSYTSPRGCAPGGIEARNQVRRRCQTCSPKNPNQKARITLNSELRQVIKRDLT